MGRWVVAVLLGLAVSYPAAIRAEEPVVTPANPNAQTPDSKTPGAQPAGVKPIDKKANKAPKPIPENPNAPANVEGTFYIPTEKNGQAVLQLRPDGVFALTAGDGTLHEGIYRYMKGWLSVDSGFHRREFTVEKDPAGLKVTRLKQDKTKSGDPIGELKPQKGETETWRRKDGSNDSVAVAAPVPAPEAPKVIAKVEPKNEDPVKVAQAKISPPEVIAPKVEPAKTDVVKVEAPKVEAPKVETAKVEPPKVEAPKDEVAKVEAPPAEPVKVIAQAPPKVEAPPPPPIQKPEPAPVKVEAPAPEPVKETKVAAVPVPAPKVEAPPANTESIKADEPKVEQITGRFRFAANTLVTETLVLRKDGAFIYKDSNGVAVAGYYQWKGTELQLTAGGMMRFLQTSTTPSGALVLTKVETASVKGGELAYMSPCTRNSAQYEKISNE